MWLFTRDGFYSIVEHRSMQDHFLVRGRVKADLERLVERIGGDTAAIVDKKGDYRWAVAIPRADVIGAMVAELTDLSYTTSVKDNIDLGEKDRHRALMRCWSAMMDLQDGGGWFSQPMSELVGTGQSSLPLWDDDLSYDEADAEDFVSVDHCDDGQYEVNIWSACGEPTTVNTFRREADANNLARDIRDCASSWDGFVSIGEVT